MSSWGEEHARLCATTRALCPVNAQCGQGFVWNSSFGQKGAIMYLGVSFTKVKKMRGKKQERMEREDFEASLCGLVCGLQKERATE